MKVDILAVKHYNLWLCIQLLLFLSLGGRYCAVLFMDGMKCTGMFLLTAIALWRNVRRKVVKLSELFCREFMVLLISLYKQVQLKTTEYFIHFL